LQALPTPLYGSENWTTQATDAKRVIAAEMTYIYMKETVEYSWIDPKTNTDIAKKLNITLILDKTHDYNRN
jgi:hypothetical protein